MSDLIRIKRRAAARLRRTPWGRWWLEWWDECLLAFGALVVSIWAAALIMAWVG